MKIGSKNNIYIKEPELNRVDDEYLWMWNKGKIFSSYQTYTMNRYSEINDALRFDMPVSYCTYDDIKNIDKIFETMPDEHLSDEPEIVYRGITKDIPKSLENILTQKSNENTFVDKGFVSTSFDKQVSKRFKGKDGYLLEITLPIKSKRINTFELPHCLRSAMKEDEVTLPRNSKFRVDSYDPDTKTAKITYLGQEFPLPEVQIEKKPSGFEHSCYNKDNLNFINKKY